MFHVEKSEIGYGSEFDLFSLPVVDGGKKRERYVNYHPNSQIGNSGLIEFSISGKGSTYVNLNKSRLRLSLKIVDEDGKAPEAWDVGFINNPLYSIFRQVDLSLNQHLISPYTGVSTLDLTYYTDAMIYYL